MTPLRILIVTPRFWPQVDDTERVAAQLAQEFCQRGHPTSILTAKWHADWPDRIVQGQAQVTRLSQAPRGGWTTFRYMRSLARWLREHRHEFDIVYVMNLRQDAYACVGAVSDVDLPVVLRAQRAGTSGDCHWQETARFGKRIRKRCQAASVVIAATRTGADELTTSGYSAVRCIAHGASTFEPRSLAAQYQARVALAEANYDLHVADYAPVAVCVERLSAGRGLAELIRAWLPIASRWPSARLWLIGDGPLRESLYESVVELGLRQQVQMPGSFDDLSELYQAADLFVSASRDYGATQALVEALAAGLPVIAADTADVRELIEDRVGGHLISPGDQPELSAGIAELLETPELAQRYGQAAQRWARENVSLQQAMDAHLELFHQLHAVRSLEHP